MNYYRRQKRAPLIKDPTLLPRLVALLEQESKLTDFGKSFVPSAIKQVKKSRGLTDRQLACLVQIETSIAAESKPLSSFGSDTIAKIEAARATRLLDGWSESFLSSIERQIKQGRSLSLAQTQQLVKITEKYNKETADAHAAWINEFE